MNTTDNDPNPTPPSDAQTKPPFWSASREVLAALGVWLGSTIGTLVIPSVLIVIYAALFDRELLSNFGLIMTSKGAALILLGGTFIVQILSVGLCWFVITQNGRKPFWSSLGWGWHSQFKWIHAVGLAILMLGVGIVLEKILPHRETDLERLLKISFSVRVAVALLATIGAPLAEEIIYRGVLYSAFVRVMGRWPGVALVTFLFALVHVPQYIESVAALTAILLLSAVLTLLRAWTRSLLPCVATHFVFNGIQGVLILLSPPAASPSAPPAPALISFLLKFSYVFQN